MRYTALIIPRDVLATPVFYFFFFNDPATPEIYTLSLHDALPIWRRPGARSGGSARGRRPADTSRRGADTGGIPDRSEEHTSELQSHSDLVCRLLLEKKKKKKKTNKDNTHNTY